MTKTNVHLIEDENLGGLLREYVESERKADVGDYVVVIKDDPTFKEQHCGEIHKMTGTDGGCGELITTTGTWYDGSELNLADDEYSTLDPTDIIHVDEDGNGRRYKLVDRKAEVGEKVIIVNANRSYGKYENGDIIEAQRRCYDMGIENDIAIAKNNTTGYIKDNEYLVLEPVESEQTEIVTVDESQASPEVIEMLGNLAQRIVKLEAELDEYRALGLKERLEDGSSLFKRIYEEIDTLHSNQKRMAEELANLAAASNSQEDSAEVIVELAKLLVEKVREGGR